MSVGVSSRDLAQAGEPSRKIVLCDDPFSPCGLVLRFVGNCLPLQWLARAAEYLRHGVIGVVV